MEHLTISDEIFGEIFYMADTFTQFKLRQTCKRFSMFDISRINISRVDTYCGTRLNDDVLSRYRTITELNIQYNKDVTNKGVEHLQSLRILDISYTDISDSGLKHMSSLQTLVARGTKITNNGLKYVPLLQTLNADDTNITDE